MSRHNVRVRAKYLYGFRKNIAKNKGVDRTENHNMFSKAVFEKQVLRERYVRLMNDAERAVGRKEAIYLLRDAEIIWQKITVNFIFFL